MSKREILGYFIAVQGGGLIGVSCLLLGIAQLEWLQPLYWVLAILGVITIFSGIGIAARAEKCCSCSE